MSKRNEKQQLQENFLKIVKEYLDDSKPLNTKELEVRFGTRGIKKTTKIDFDNVIEKLRSNGFTCYNSGGSYEMRVQNEFLDAKSGETKVSNVRAEISGSSAIQKYCKTNRIVENIDDLSSISSEIKFVQKRYSTNVNGPIYPVNFDDFNFRVTLQEENILPKNGGFVRNIVEKWNQSKKIFRYMNRVTLTHPEMPIKVDLSTVKSSKKIRGRAIPEYTTMDADLFNNEEEYEIEIEVDGTEIEFLDYYKVPKNLMAVIRKCSMIILSGLQQTNFPISYSEQNDVVQEYADLFMKKDNDKDDEDLSGRKNPRFTRRIYPSHFIGPSSYTLQMSNIGEVSPDDTFPNIRNNYTVTDKADGLRKLLFVAKEESRKGKIYLIDTNMNIQFTGAKTDNPELFNTLIDGEHILHNKRGEFINLFAAFDIYFVKGSDVRSFNFINETSTETKGVMRLPMLNNVVRELDIKSVIREAPNSFRLEPKQFQYGNGELIFNACQKILERVNDGLFEYETDGLIFTPASIGVGVDKEGDTPKNSKITWKHSFKWKPARHNTIDFLVSTQKSESGDDAIKNIYQEGVNVAQQTNIKQYKTLILRVGFDEKKHGYLNPCQNLYDLKIPSLYDIDNEESYKPVPFYPTSPYDPKAGVCNILLREDGNGTPQLFTEANETFTDNMIVEFKYDHTRETEWKWVPIKVRYDKTAELNKGLKNYGNAYHVANSNWHSIHNPITERMISTGKNIPDQVAEEDVYYNRKSDSTITRRLRDFHNLYVKRKLILSVAHNGDTLIDYSVGKGGDLPKWISAKLNFVFGIDISRDNIFNRLDGACARYLNYSRKFRRMPGALFVNGNSGVNIRNTDAAYSEKGKQVINAVFGEGSKDRKQLGEGVYKHFGKGKDGFVLSSCQFSLHYFFETNDMLHRFLRNVSECTKLGGYFIATCYDGNLIFDALREKKEGEAISITKGKKKMWEVQKLYQRNDFEPDETSVGYAINVYQESINKVFREYLVNHNYLIRVMENYGFTPLPVDEANVIGLPSGTGLFNELFSYMKNEVSERKIQKSDIGTSLQMTAEEKQISFYNRYFVFKKMRDVDAKSVMMKSATMESVAPELVVANEGQGEETTAPEELEQPPAEEQPPTEVEANAISENTTADTQITIKKKKKKKLGKKLKLKLIEQK